MMEAAYTLLLSTPPFSGWRLPLADDVEFHVTKSVDDRGDYFFENDTHIIRLSACLIGSLHELLTTMAHEICHMRQELAAPDDPEHHGARFQKYADRVCHVHGFDRKAF
jgi:hypothetical protein